MPVAPPAAPAGNAPSHHINCVKAGYAALLTLMLLSILLAIGGVGALNDQCGNNSACMNLFRYPWWIVFFDLIIWCVLVILVWGNHIAHYKIPVVAFLVLVTSQTMLQAEQNISLWNSCIDARSTNPFDAEDQEADFNGGCGDRYETNLSAAGAGFVLLSLCNFIWIIVAGSSSDSLVAAQMPATGEALPLGAMPQYATRRKSSVSKASATQEPSAVEKWDTTDTPQHGTTASNSVGVPPV